MARIGLIAGYGKLPKIFCRLAKSKGDTIIAFGLKGVTEDDLADYVDKMHWIEWGSFQKALLLLVTERISKIMMLGKIKKEIFFKGDEKLDSKARKALDNIKDRKDYSILDEVSRILSSMGVEIIDATQYLKDLIPQEKGTLTKRAPTEDESSDIAYGKEVARELARFDIGQTVTVKDKTLIALEAAEGTDETIKRAGALSKVGFSVIKVARPDQDMRFDVPLVGPETLKILIESGGKALALEEKKTFLMDKEEMVRLADENNISIVII